MAMETEKKTLCLDATAALIAIELEFGPIGGSEQGQARALRLCASRGEPEALKALLGMGADPNAVDDWGNSALHVAVISGRVKCAQFLIQAGAKLEALDGDGRTALMMASCRTNLSSPLESLEMLIIAGSNLEARDSEGCTALMLSAKSSGLEQAKTLITAGADALAKNFQGKLALDFAIEGQQVEIIEILGPLTRALLSKQEMLDSLSMPSAFEARAGRKTL